MLLIYLMKLRKKLKLNITPLSFPIGMGYDFKGIYNLWEKNIILFNDDNKSNINDTTEISIDDNKLKSKIGENSIKTLKEEVELVNGIYPEFKKVIMNVENNILFFLALRLIILVLKNF